MKVEILLELLIGFQNLVTGPGARTARPGAESQGYHATFTGLLGPRQPSSFKVAWSPPAFFP